MSDVKRFNCPMCGHVFTATEANGFVRLEDRDFQRALEHRATNIMYCKKCSPEEAIEMAKKELGVLR